MSEFLGLRWCTRVCLCQNLLKIYLQSHKNKANESLISTKIYENIRVRTETGT